MSKKILIVDDEKMLTRILSEYFQKEKGYTVFSAEDGKTAEDIIKKENLDLVLLDMKLPKVDGIELLSLLRKHFLQTKVIAMTCYDVEYKKKMDAVGYDYFFMKPLTICDLQDKIEELLALETMREPRKTAVSAEKETVSLKETGAVPKAKILIIEPRENISSLLKDFFQEESLSGGDYTVTNIYAHNIQGISHFAPNIVLYDIIQIGTFSRFASQLMKFNNPPCEIILFGDPSLKWEEVDALIERGMKYVQTPLKSISNFLSQDPEFELPSKETVQRLAKVVKGVCLKYGLIKRESN